MPENYKILGQDSLTVKVSEEYGFEAFVASNSYGNGYPDFYLSTDGIDWTTSTITGISEISWKSLGYGNGTWAAFTGNGNNNGKIAYSKDGLTWTETAYPAGVKPFGGNWTGVVYGNGIFVAALSQSNENYPTSYSTDGVTWTTSNFTGFAPAAVAYGGGKFVVYSYNYNAADTAAYSADGIDWTIVTLPTGAGWDANYWAYPDRMTYGSGAFVVTSHGWYNNSNVIYSTDAITWELRPIPAGNWHNIAYGSDRFVVVPYYSNASAMSTDAITWTLGTLPSVGRWQYVEYGAGKFVAAGYANYASAVAYSTDGLVWTQASIEPSSFSGLSGQGIVDVVGINQIYTTPASTQTSVSSVSIINNDTVSHTYSLGIVKAADTATAGITATQTIIPTRTIEPGVVDEIVGGITLSAGDEIRTNSDSTDLKVHIYGVEIS